MSITLRLFEPASVANTSFDDGTESTPYGLLPTVTLPDVTGGLFDRSSTLMLSDPGFAT
jgi:hypothetical protein